ncbi:MAG TPA: hypothetical protein DCE43_18035 [Planctomycetaceae bacterium]|nr:hypothetical protein [Planctomycetaceae bacterium]
MTEKPPGSFRILHTADWHLGKLLIDQSREEEHDRFLDWLLDVVKEQEIDAIILAGDVFDTTNPPQSAQERYFNFVSALHRQGDCSLVVIAGNHDSAAHLEAPRMVLSALNTHVVGSPAEDPQARILFLPDDDNPRVAIAMLPFLRERDLRIGRAWERASEIRAKVVAGIKCRYDETAEAVTAAGVTCQVVATGHLTVRGTVDSDSERDIHIGGLGEVSSDIFPETFSYIALGHLHRPQSIEGDNRVCYAGSPIALSFSEAEDVKEVRIVDVTQDRITQNGLPIPVQRRLAQLRTTNAELEKAIQEFDPVPGELRTWVEVFIEDVSTEQDLFDRVCRLADDQDFDVLKVVRAKANPGVGMDAGESTDDEAFESLLNDPASVFDHLLEQQPQYDDEDIQNLRAAFAELVELNEQSEPLEAS